MPPLTYEVYEIGNSSLVLSPELRKLYQILPDEAAEESGLLRVVDESGEDYPYPAGNFIRPLLPAAVEQALADLPVGDSRVSLTPALPWKIMSP